ncbi:unnamed protein product [Haemonchus placei]|uniref:3'-5' exonuclease domain-containing protein n=1 Tax=Haemonchus placei TaxID=6290 RepID=A0A0N4WSA4_HAEPC|nr:unnamed protein product [Haemonchus placei]
MEDTPSSETISSTSAPADEAPRKLTKAEKKALYRVTHAEPLETRRKVLKDVYLNEKDELLKEELLTTILFSIFEIDENPYDSMLQLHKISPDYSSNKPKSLAGTIATSFYKWLLKRDDSTELFHRCVTEELQMEAFRIATAKHTGYLKLFKEVFRLKEPDLLNYVKEEINNMIDRHMFKEAMDVVEEFGLQSDYGLHAFVIPCLLQDKLSLVIKYVENDRKMQESLVAYLDSFVGMSECDVIGRLREYKDNQIMTMQYERFTGKTIEKMVYKLTNELALPVESVAPNLFRARKEGDLRFKVQARFVNRELNDDAYFGHISHFASILKLLSILMSLHDYSEDAVRWVVYCNIPDARLPRRLREYIRDTPGVLDEAESDIRRLEARALDIGDDDPELMPGYPIITITTWKQLGALTKKLEGETHIGIDSEWKPQYASFSENIALLQIATKDAVYLVDFISLKMGNNIKENELESFLRSLLCCPSMKIGFDLTNDLRTLFAGSSMSQLRSIADDLCNVVCIKMLVENLIEEDRGFFDKEGLTSSIHQEDLDDDTDSVPLVHFKLSDLSEKLLGAKLDKSEQCSNWTIRPLRASQKRYAAMDAYIVVEIFSKLKASAEARGIDFRAMIQKSCVSAKKKERTKSKKERMKIDDMPCYLQRLEDVLSGTRPATELQCIVDSMLLGLGKNLRRCGVNVLIPENRYDLKCRACGNNRIILTSGKAYDELRPLFPSRVLCIPNAGNLNPIEQLKYVFNRHKVSLSGQDVFSRCMECNASCFVKVPGPVIQALFENVVLCRSGFHDDVFDFNGWAEKLSSVDPRNYSGVGCRLILCNNNDMVVECYGGTVDIISNIVTHDHLEEGVDVIVRRVPEQVVSRPGNVFFLCGSCGKVYWDSDTHVT